jgi:hypothetical protein
MRARALVLLALAAIVVLIAGFVLYNALAMDTVEYMGLKYGPSEHAILSADKLYYTGETSGGAKLYAAGWESPQKVPPLLFKKDLLGTNRPYYLLADNPPVYAYTPYVRYNLGEPVTIGLMDKAGGKVELRNSAPFEIQEKEGGEWKTIYRPVAAQVIIPLENGTFKEWTWEQQYSGGGNVGEGDYRAVINGQYAVYFTISKGAPVIKADARDYSQGTVQKAFFDAPPGTPLNIPEHSAFAEYYQNSASREDIASEMAFKAWMKSLDADKLYSTLKSIMPASGGIEIPFISGDFIPCLAIHASFDGKPAWFIVINWGMGGEKLGHIKYYAIDDETGKTVYYLTCK